MRFVFVYHRNAEPERMYSWHLEADRFDAGRSFGGWHGSREECVREARDFQREVSEAGIPDEPEFSPMGS